MEFQINVKNGPYAFYRLRAKRAMLYVLLVWVCMAFSCRTGTAKIPQATDSALSLTSDLDGAVHLAVLDQLGSDWLGEAKTEGHIVLAVEEKDGVTTVYAITSYCAYGFENNLFTIETGNWAIPSVLRFSKNLESYELKSYEEAMEGDYFEDSVKAMFPQRLWGDALYSFQYSDTLQDQQEQQAKAYLQSIGRDAQIHSDYVEKESFHISVEAANTLLNIPTLFDYPQWIGSRETIEGGVRHIYEASEQDFSRYTVIVFTKKTESGKILQRIEYKIIGDTVKQI